MSKRFKAIESGLDFYVMDAERKFSLKWDGGTETDDEDRMAYMQQVADALNRIPPNGQTKAGSGS
jgi:hypothetical protein